MGGLKSKREERSENSLSRKRQGRMGGAARFGHTCGHFKSIDIIFNFFKEFLDKS